MNENKTDFVVALLGLLSTALTALYFSLSIYVGSESGAMLSALQGSDVGTLELAIPLVAGLTVLQLVHELAHFLAAQLHGLKLGIPILVPSLQLGFLGGITRVLSMPATKKAMFDFALAGPAVAGSLSFAVYLAGLFLSAHLPNPTDVPAAVAELPVIMQGTSVDSAMAFLSSFFATSAMPEVSTDLLHSSMLLSSFARLIVPAAGTETIVPLHPLALIGFVSCMVNALQLVPIGRLDGGRVATAMLGQGSANLLSLVFLFYFACLDTDSLLCFWPALLYCFQRKADVPSIDDLSSIDCRRQSLATVAAVVAVLTLLPLPLTPSDPAVGDFLITGGLC